ncbi:conserved hypothetical protein [Uncinocarpus reesii 1704]|uniref:WW domain-containing protein n=1 Tax=Uncinocarpus reesii (strain UAMH 1704) TaxID=336963 RepID=C4JMM2_UNCRE|nr:uncharacterized protein UREG_04080 [Uncinocarpus reesii 1704]EEP79234.1 conserved hypothetical protein [Uncinocarpus reesii 1704]
MHASSLYPLALAFLSLLSLSAATILTISIPASNLLPNPNTLPPSTHATLTTLTPKRALLKAPLTRSSTFIFPDLGSGSDSASSSRSPTSYLLDIHSRDYVFAPYRVDVGADGNVIGVWETFRGNPWDNKGVEKAVGTGSGPVHVDAKVLGKREFYEQRAGFSPLSLFKNPMILLAVFALGVTVGMPYLLENTYTVGIRELDSADHPIFPYVLVDPETREEFEKQRAKGVLPGSGSKKAAGPSFDLAGWMAGTSPSPIEVAREASTSAREGGSGQPAPSFNNISLSALNLPWNHSEKSLVFMSFAPPSGPPPPPVPEGWRAQYSDAYRQWYYVDLSTGVSQWDPPTMPTESVAQPPVRPPAASSSPPPSYEASGSGNTEAAATAAKADQKKGPLPEQPQLGSNNPYLSENSNRYPHETPVSPEKKDVKKSPDSGDDDARLAAQLQEEENERARQQGYDSVLEANNTEPRTSHSTRIPEPTLPSPSSSNQQQSKGKSGFFGKLLDKAKRHASSSASSSTSRLHAPHAPHAPHSPHASHAAYYSPSPQPQSQYMYPPQQQPFGGYAGYPQQGAGGYYGAPFPPQQGYVPHNRLGGRGGGGMGMAGAAALGMGGGLLGGALLANALDDDYGDGYQDGFGDGGDFGGGDFGGFD